MITPDVALYLNGGPLATMVVGTLLNVFLVGLIAFTWRPTKIITRKIRRPQNSEERFKVIRCRVENQFFRYGKMVVSLSLSVATLLAEGPLYADTARQDYAIDSAVDIALHEERIFGCVLIACVALPILVGLVSLLMIVRVYATPGMFRRRIFFTRGRGRYLTVNFEHEHFFGAPVDITRRRP